MGKTKDLKDRLREASFGVEDPELALLLTETTDWLGEIDRVLRVYRLLENAIDLRCRLGRTDKINVEMFWDDELPNCLAQCDDKHHLRHHAFGGQKDYESQREYRP